MRGRTARRATPLIATLATTVLATAVGCSTTSGDSGTVTSTVETAPDPSDDGTAAYVAFMDALCTATDERIDLLPSPPDQIRADLWAAEVATAYARERDAADVEATPPEDLRRDHRTYVETTDELVDAWTALAASLAADADDIGDRRTDVTQLALGRDATAAVLGLDVCDRSGA